jgi:glucose-1-phosphate thymidylyltransferase
MSDPLSNHNYPPRKRSKRIVGLIPAAGQATRLAPLPFSKELYPIGQMRIKGSEELRPKPVCIYLLEKMRAAGAEDAYIVLRKGKWDIPAYLGDGSLLDMNLAYLIMELPYGVPYTLDQAYPFIQEAIVTFGFPDIIFHSAGAFNELLDRLETSQADVVLGLFPVDQPSKFHMVELSRNGRIHNIVLNPVETHLEYTWIMAVWTRTFTQFIHQYLMNIIEKERKLEVVAGTAWEKELHLSEVLQHAIESKLKVEGVIFAEDSCLDIGTHDGLTKAVGRFPDIMAGS